MGKFSILLAFLMCSMYFLFCSGNSVDVNCDSVKLNKSVFVYGRENCKIDYLIDNRLIDISDSIGIERWGSDEIKRYVFSSDTLTIRWNYAAGQYDSAAPLEVINKTILLDSIHYISQKLEKFNNEQVCGMYSILYLKNKFIIIFNGWNETFDIILNIDFKTKKFDENDKNIFNCMLKSFKFSPTKK